MQNKLIIVADDFTGANDTGVQFKKAGFNVNVIINTNNLNEDLELSDILVIDLESRYDSKEVAYRKCYDLGKQLLLLGITNLYKKLDSTFRGNIGAEIDGLMDSLQIKLLILAPAWPANGRTTENGEVFVNGVKLSETDSAIDPRNPIKNSGIADILRTQSQRISSEITKEILDLNSIEISRNLQQKITEGAEILIFDSYIEEDLEKIAGLIETFSDIKILIAGSAGLASHLKTSFIKRKNPYCFVFSGSVSEKSRNQIKYTLNECNCGLFFMESEYLLDYESSPDKLIDSVAKYIESGMRRFIFTSALTRDDVDKVFSNAHRKGLTQDSAAETVARVIGRLAAVLIDKFRPAGVLLTGGDIAIKTVNALNATGISIDQEILPGISSGTLTGCAIRSIIATKSGGFGDEDAISRTFEFFKV
jgi:D-threonate/D-erythronate kinase